MFDDVGGKIQGIATITCFVGIIASVIGGFIIMFSKPDAFFAGILTMVIGSGGAYVGSLMMYGFGHLIESVDSLASKQKAIVTKASVGLEKPPVDYLKNAATKSNKDVIKSCPYCGDTIRNGKCEMCGKEIK